MGKTFLPQIAPNLVALSPDEIRGLHRDARLERRRQVQAMEPGERILRAYRLFTLWRTDPEGVTEADPMRELEDVIGHLRTQLETVGVPFAIGGAFALAALGHPRFTYNLDVMVLTGLDHAHRALEHPRYEQASPLSYRETTTDLMIDLHPVRDEAQRWAADQAVLTAVLGSEVKVLTAEGLALMLLREATEGDEATRPLRLRDLELLDREPGVDWSEIERLIEDMGYGEAYREVRG